MKKILVTTGGTGGHVILAEIISGFIDAVTSIGSFPFLLSFIMLAILMSLLCTK